MLKPSGAIPRRDHVRTQFPKHGRGNPVRRAVCAIDDDLQSVQASTARKARLGCFDVPPGGVVKSRRATKRLGCRQSVCKPAVHQALDFQLGLVGELGAIGSEQLDAVVLVRIVGSRDHHAEIGTQRSGEHGDRRRRDRPEKGHVHAGTDQAGGQRRFDHVTGQPRVLADHRSTAMIVTGEPQAGGLPKAQCHACRHWVAVGLAADTVGAEQAPACGHVRDVGLHRATPMSIDIIRVSNESRVNPREARRVVPFGAPPNP